MKKFLFCASLVVLAASCTQDETLSLDVQNESRGVTFEMAEPVESRIQYDKNTDGSWAPFWFAEQDRISIFATGVTKGYNVDEESVETASEGDWEDFSNNVVAQYKATKSKKSAEFTSVDDANMLMFSNDKKTPKFLAVYPYNVDYSLTTKKDSLIISGALTNFASQTVGTAKGHNEAIVQWAYNDDVTNKEAYESVGEKVKLTYSFATPVIKFGTNGLDENYQTAFGKLNSIAFQTKGYTDTTTPANSIAASKLTYASANIKIDTLNWKQTIEGELAEGTAINVTIGQKWSDDALAPIAIAEVDRSAFDKKNVKETYYADFTFDYIDLRAGGVNGKTTKNSWTRGGNFYAVTLDMADFDYLVTKAYTKEVEAADGTTSTVNVGRTLFVINGDFSAILTEDKDAINWDDSQTADEAPVAFTEIETVVVEEGVVLDAEDFKVLDKLTNVKSLTLKGNTSIPTKALKSLTSLEILDLPKVESVGADAFKANLKEVYMPTYKFDEGTTINKMLLKPETLEKLNMGATNMNASFPENGLLLTDYAVLKEVTVKDGIKLGANAFQGCKFLAKVNGVVDIVGTGTFQDCSMLESIIVSDKDIVDNTFKNCSELSAVYYLTKDVVLKPNYVGEYAFEGTKVNLDLSETTIIAKGAFKNADSLIGIDYKNQKVVKVGATSIGVGAFSGAEKFAFIYFMNATTVDNYMLSGTTALKEIKFGKPFVYGGEDKAAAGTFGANEGVKLFIVEEQTGVAGNTLTVGTGTNKSTFKFSQIEVEDAE